MSAAPVALGSFVPLMAAGPVPFQLPSVWDHHRLSNWMFAFQHTAVIIAALVCRAEKTLEFSSLFPLLFNLFLRSKTTFKCHLPSCLTWSCLTWSFLVIGRIIIVIIVNVIKLGSISDYFLTLCSFGLPEITIGFVTRHSESILTYVCIDIIITSVFYSKFYLAYFTEFILLLLMWTTILFC